ncbi:MAG: hypothetical protein RBR24_00360 [Candidatus Carbobacillus sp.]|nr:hypothetical protein [Candidatus Carbobacillus sp.]
MNLKLIELQVAIPRTVDLGIALGARAATQAYLTPSLLMLEQKKIDRAQKRIDHAPRMFLAQNDPQGRGRYVDARL